MLFFKRMRIWALESVKYRAYDKKLKKKVIKYDMKLFKTLRIRGAKKKWYLRHSYIYSYEEINSLRKLFKKKTIFYWKKKKKYKEKFWKLTKYNYEYYNEDINYYYICFVEDSLKILKIIYNQFFYLSFLYKLDYINLIINEFINLNFNLKFINDKNVYLSSFYIKKKFYKLKSVLIYKKNELFREKFFKSFFIKNKMKHKEYNSIYNLYNIRKHKKLKIYFNKFNLQFNKIKKSNNIINNKYFNIYYTYRTYEKIFNTFFYKRLKDFKDFNFFLKNYINQQKFDKIKNYWIIPELNLNYNKLDIKEEEESEEGEEISEEDYHTNYNKKYIKNYDKDDDKVIIFNFFQKKVKTYKNARLVHWGLKHEQKLIKENRYKKFINKHIKKKLKLKINTENIIIYYFLNLNFNLSWKFSIYFFNKIFSITKINLIKQFNIYRLPINKTFKKIIKFFKKKHKKNLKKTKRWSYLKFLKVKQFWKMKKSALPKFVKQNKIFLKNFNNILQFDKITQSFIILKHFYKNIKLNTNILEYNNKLYKITNFKYRS